MTIRLDSTTRGRKYKLIASSNRTDAHPWILPTELSTFGAAYRIKINYNSME